MKTLYRRHYYPYSLNEFLERYPANDKTISTIIKNAELKHVHISGLKI